MKYRIITKKGIYVSDDQQLVKQLVVGISDLANSRKTVISAVRNLSEHFIEHFLKIHNEPFSENIPHWQTEMEAAYKKAMGYKCKHNNKPLSRNELEQVFFVPESDKIPPGAYDDYKYFIEQLDNTNNVRSAWEITNKHIQKSKINQFTQTNEKSKSTNINPQLASRTKGALIARGVSEEETSSMSKEQAEKIILNKQV